MNKNIKQLLIILFIGVILFYGVPSIGRIVSTDLGMFFFVLSLLILNPLYSSISSFIYAFCNNKIEWFLPILIGLLFVPSIFIFYNSSAFVYSAAYALISFIAMISGRLINNSKG